MEAKGYGHLRAASTPALLPPLYIAYSTKLSEGTEVFHNDIRGRFDRGDPDVVGAMEHLGRSRPSRPATCIVAGRGNEIGPLLDANFDLRRKIYQISEGNLRMVETARATGASAKFTGSGGAIVGTYRDESMFNDLVAALSPLGIHVIKPVIESQTPDLKSRI